MAAKGQHHHDMNVLTPGIPRDVVVAEFGAPVNTEKTNEGLADIFRFVQGDPSGAKAFRAVGHGAMDVLTLGLWEVVGTPTEASLDGQDIAVKVVYDEKEKVKNVVYLKKR